MSNTLIGPPIEVRQDPITGDVAIRNVNDPRAAIVATADEWQQFLSGVAGLLGEYVCPACRAERTDYEGPGMHLTECPNCDSAANPVAARLMRGPYA